MSEFDPNWKFGHQTRDGRKARIICTDRKGIYGPIVVLVEERDNELIYHYGADGKRPAAFFPSNDLVNAPEPKTKMYLIIYSYSDKWYTYGNLLNELTSRESLRSFKEDFPNHPSKIVEVEV